MELNVAEYLYKELEDRNIHVHGEFAGHMDKHAHIWSEENRADEKYIKDMVGALAEVIERDAKKKVVEFGCHSIPDSKTDAIYQRHKGITVRRMKKYDIDKDSNILRWDITYNVR